MKETKPLQKKRSDDRKKPLPRLPETDREEGDLIAGRNAVRELLRSGRTVDKILI